VNEKTIALLVEDITLAGLTTQFVWNDYAELTRKYRIQDWTDETSVPQSVFGPLDEELSAKSLAFELVAPEILAPNVIGESLVKLWEAANEYHMARGGGVLTFDEFKQMMPALVPVGPESRG